MPEELPLCVKAAWWSKQARYGGHVMLNVGQVRRDKQTRLAAPTLELIFAGSTESSTPDHGPVGFRDLAELEQSVLSLRRMSR
jgi:hypothetical protein